MLALNSVSVYYFVARRVQQAGLSGSREIVSVSLSDHCGLLLSQDGSLFLLQLQSPQPLTAAAAYSKHPQLSISLKELTTFEVRHTYTRTVSFIVLRTVYVKSSILVRCIIYKIFVLFLIVSTVNFNSALSRLCLKTV